LTSHQPAEAAKARFCTTNILSSTPPRISSFAVVSLPASTPKEMEVTQGDAPEVAAGNAIVASNDAAIDALPSDMRLWLSMTGYPEGNNRHQIIDKVRKVRESELQARKLDETAADFARQAGELSQVAASFTRMADEAKQKAQEHEAMAKEANDDVQRHFNALTTFMKDLIVPCSQRLASIVGFEEAASSDQPSRAHPHSMNPPRKHENSDDSTSHLSKAPKLAEEVSVRQTRSQSNPVDLTQDTPNEISIANQVIEKHAQSQDLSPGNQA